VKHGTVFTFEGVQYLAKITTKAYPNQEKQNFYNVESISVEKINAHGIHKTITKGQSLDVSDENRISQLVDSVKENNRGQIEMTPEDIAVLPYILNDFDAAKRMVDFDDKLGNKSIDFYKRINGVSVVATISKGKYKQFVVTGWKVKSVAAMPQDVALRLNALNDTDIHRV
jgi:hypothetical protein